MPPDEINLAAMAETLAKSPDYLVLRKLMPRTEFAPCEGQPTKTGILLDVETSGLDTARDEVIELAMVKFTYLPNDRIARITDVFTAELANIVESSFNVHEVGTHEKRYCFKLPENPESKLKSWARNDRAFDPQSAPAPGLLSVRRDQEYIKQVLNYLLKTPDGTSEPPSQPVVLDPNWEKAPWANLPQADQPTGWTERGKPVLLVLPVAPKPINEVLGPWLAEHVAQNRNMIRFLLPKSDCSSFYDDRNLLITARCALLASEWKQTDTQYAKLHTKFEGALKAELKSRFDRYAILATWDFQTPKNCKFDDEAHGASGSDIPAAIEKHVAENHFAREDFEAFVVQAAARNESVRQVLALLREPPLPGQTAIPYLGDVFTYDQILRIVAKGKVALNAAGRWWHREPGESFEEASVRLHQKAWFDGQAMFAVQLGEISQVGGGGVAVTVQSTPIPSPTLFTPVHPVAAPSLPTAPNNPPPPVPIGFPVPQQTPAQPVIRRSLGAKTGANLLGEIEKWALPDGQKVTQAVFTLNAVSIKELRDLCVKLPPKLQAELQLNLPPDEGAAE